MHTSENNYFYKQIVCWMISTVFFTRLVTFALSLWSMFTSRRLENDDGSKQGGMKKQRFCGVSSSRISCIIPARNEGPCLSEAVSSRLEDTSENLEFIVINDRSTDNTSEIVDSLVTKDLRVKALHIESLGRGWLGKVHAMQKGYEKASGEWLVFSDADVFVKKGAMNSLVNYAQINNLDFLAVIPRFLPAGFLVDSALSVFLRLIWSAIVPEIIENPAFSAAAGSGSMNIVKRESFEKNGAFESLRMEITDDICLARSIKAAGGKCAVILAPEDVSLTFYKSPMELVRGLGKNAITTIGGYSYFRLAGAIFIFSLMEFLPFSVFFGKAGRKCTFRGVFSIVIVIFQGVLSDRIFGRPVIPHLLFPFGSALLIYTMTISFFKNLISGKVHWRDTEYCIAELSENSAFHITNIL